jgi:2-succinyl-6-hydroxy-2,4-cyclohexadiene-1-carboxylate synthase
MIFKYQGYDFFYKTSFSLDNTNPILFFLHGFANDSRDWNEVISLLPKSYNWITIDLPGFGNSCTPKETYFYTTEFMVNLIDELVKYLNIDKINLVGYSMGGRIALSYASKHNDNLSSLILESSSPGLKTKLERQLRTKSDLELAEFIQNNSIDDFAIYWKNLPLFSSQKKLSEEKKEILFNRMIELNKDGLIESLKGFSLGIMPDLWNYLSEFHVKTLLITGELDDKYLSINKEMNQLLPNSKLKIVKNTGHNIHLEKPEEFVNLLSSFLQNQK